MGPYQVEALIGRGAMGTVYLARDVKLNRAVALKVLLGSLARNKTAVRRFHLEAQAAAPLHHPNIVRVYSAGIEKGIPFIAMEYVEGEPFDRFLRRTGQLHWVNALYVGEQVALALDAAHRGGVVHRDVKPGNIMLDRAGKVRLMDFGIASIRTEERDIPEDAGPLGTPQYMAPEQFLNQEVGPKSDIFSLGVVLYQAISGHLPFEGESSMALIKSITTEDPPRLNKIVLDVPDDVARLIAYMMEKDPRKRPASGRVICALIKRVQEQKGGSSAIPEALTSFIRDQAKPRQVDLATPAPKKRRAGAWRKRMVGASLVFLRRAATVALILGLGTVSFGFFPYRTLQAKRAIPTEAPRLTSGILRELPSGEIEAHVLNDGFRIEALNWVGNTSTVIASVTGKKGSLLAQSRGVLAVDLEKGALLSLRAPSSPSIDVQFWRREAPALEAHALPTAPDGTPLSGTVLQSIYEESRRRKDGHVVLVAQRWDERAPRSAVLYRYAMTDWNYDWGTDRSGVLARHAVPKPDGYTICLVLFDPSQKSYYLAERDVRWRPLEKVGRRLTTWRGQIIPESVVYSPDGNYLAYAREIKGGHREAWILSPESGDVNGRLIASGDIGGRLAFSRDSVRLALKVGAGEVAIFRSSSGEREAILQAGDISKEAWHPSGNYVVALAPGGADSRGAGENQLWAIQSAWPYRGYQLTRAEKGFGSAYAVSWDGHWVVGVVDAEGYPRLLFTDLTRIDFSGGVSPS